MFTTLSSVSGSESFLSRYPRPENRVHLCHIWTPRDNGICQLDVIVTTARLINPKCLIECGHNRTCHTVSCIWVHCIWAETTFIIFLGLHKPPFTGILVQFPNTRLQPSRVPLRFQKATFWIGFCNSFGPKGLLFQEHQGVKLLALFGPEFQPFVHFNFLRKVGRFFKSYSWFHYLGFLGFKFTFLDYQVFQISPLFYPEARLGFPLFNQGYGIFGHFLGWQGH